MAPTCEGLGLLLDYEPGFSATQAARESEQRGGSFECLKEDGVSQADFEGLKAFLEARPVAIRAASPLKESALITITIVGDPAPYYVSREGKRTTLLAGAPPKPAQVAFTISPKAIADLCAYKSEDIGEFGVHFFKLMRSSDPEIQLDVRLHTGFLGLMSMGVFNVLALGGTGVMSFLARHGFKSLKEIRKAIAGLRGGKDD